MPRFDDSFADPGIEVSLAVIDATLAGEAVEPDHAELAELTLILAGERPAAGEAWTQALDELVASRFAPRRAVTEGGTGRRRRRWRWQYAPGVAAALAAAVAAVVVLVSSGTSSRPLVTGIAAQGSTTASSAAAVPSVPQRSAASPATASPTSSGAPSTAGGSPSPPTSGRKVVQAAQLSLTTRPDQVDAVAQQVFDVVGAQDGVVESSTVAASGASGYAQFRLSVPSDNLRQTMSALSRLHGAAVASRIDSSEDITGQVGGAGERLADARALRTSLLRQLANATTQQQINSLRVQLRDAEASISRDLATLRSLHGKVDNSQISVTVNAAMGLGHPVSHGGGFTIGRAAHDAGRVLVVAAGAALIALAVLVPLSLVAALALWLGSTLRRRRREQVLDLM